MLSRYAARRLMHKFYMVMSLAMMAFGLFWLAWIMWTLLKLGVSGISWDVFTKMTPAPGNSGGLLNAIYGSLLMAGAGTALGTPVGLMAGIYLAEYGAKGWLAPVTRFINDILLSAPSIVIGLFIYEVFVFQVGHFSGWAGACALALIVIPVVIRTTENMLRLVPASLREAAAALGAPRWKVTLSVALRAVKGGVLTGVLLAVARISGETAPLLFTALNNQFWTSDMNTPMANLPVVIFQFAMSPYESWHHLAWTGALLITMFVLGLNIIARVLVRQKT